MPPNPSPMIETLADVVHPFVYWGEDRQSAVAATRALLLSLREQAGDPGVVEAMEKVAEPLTGQYSAGEIGAFCLVAAIDHILKGTE